MFDRFLDETAAATDGVGVPVRIGGACRNVGRRSCPIAMALDIAPRHP
jgi:hypothetical protein